MISSYEKLKPHSLQTTSSIDLGKVESDPVCSDLKNSGNETQVWTYKCTECSQTFSEHCLLVEHLWKHIHEKPFKCSDCPRQFDKVKQLHYHSKIHFQLSKCKFCSLEFSSITSLRRHYRSVGPAENLKKLLKLSNGGLPLLCHYCGKQFSQVCAITFHIRKHESGMKAKHKAKNLFPIFNQVKSVLMVKTDKSFASRKCHLARQRARGNRGTTFSKVLKCEICLKEYANAKSLWDHRRIHTGSGYFCTTCNSFFRRPSLLRLHMAKAKHSSTLPFCCTKCSLWFESLVSLKAHKRVMHKGKFRTGKTSVKQEILPNYVSLESAPISKWISLPPKSGHCSIGIKTNCSASVNKQNVHLSFLSSPKEERIVQHEAGPKLKTTKRRPKGGLKTSMNQKGPHYVGKRGAERLNDNKASSAHATASVSHLKLQGSKTPLREEWQAIFSKFKLHSSNSSSVSKETACQTYACSLCPKTYRSIAGLKCHVERHFGAAPLQCSLCPGKFSYAYTLRKHIRVKHLTN